MPIAMRAQAESIEPKASIVPEHLNRCLPDTDKAGRAWQKLSVRCKAGALKSVCRELPRVALAAQVRRVYRLRMNRDAQTCLPQMRLRCGVHSHADQMPLMQMPLMNVLP